MSFKTMTSVFSIVCLLYVCLPFIQGHALKSDFGSNVRNIRSEPCEGFECANRQCISEDYRCDGKVDCSDGSDETDDDCKTLPCPGYLFTCNYGACITAHKKCDGVKDCRDNSDESNCSSHSATAVPL